MQLLRFLDGLDCAQRNAIHAVPALYGSAESTLLREFSRAVPAGHSADGSDGQVARGTSACRQWLPEPCSRTGVESHWPYSATRMACSPIFMDFRGSWRGFVMTR